MVRPPTGPPELLSDAGETPLPLLRVLRVPLVAVVTLTGPEGKDRLPVERSVGEGWVVRARRGGCPAKLSNASATSSYSSNSSSTRRSGMADEFTVGGGEIVGWVRVEGA